MGVLPYSMTVQCSPVGLQRATQQIVEVLAPTTLIECCLIRFLEPSVACSQEGWTCGRHSKEKDLVVGVEKLERAAADCLTLTMLT